MGRSRRRWRRRRTKRRIGKDGSEEPSFIVRRELFRSIWAANSRLLNKNNCKPIITLRCDQPISAYERQKRKTIRKMKKTCIKLLRRRSYRQKRYIKQTSHAIQSASEASRIPDVNILIGKLNRRRLKRRRTRKVKKIKTQPPADSFTEFSLMYEPYPVPLEEEEPEKPTSTRSRIYFRSGPIVTKSGSDDGIPGKSRDILKYYRQVVLELFFSYSSFCI
ncbi:hypothetical protein EVAR_96825_1 [Eumeta japonica]|uniref:Uncharacterized protein n=1 Tax=Eumeta variegata TaxID=151549 RepID=A0A4C1WA13_EUMVA|nr:hypothetical protein EVAR_96825_1 [Eumeta japonica]